MISSVLGWFGEKKTTFKMWLHLDAKTYQRRHNVIVPSQSGSSQIDHLIVSSSGIFIIETKNLKGWIFGAHSQSHWTQVIFGKKYKFQNPIRQTFRQRKVLAEYLGIGEDMIHVVIYFAGRCRFKTLMPSNVINGGLTSYIKSYYGQILAPEIIHEVLNKIDTLRSDPGLTSKEHVRSLRERYRSTTICPKCGSQLVERTAKKGFGVDSAFLGCASYPRCRYTKNVS